MPPLLAAALGSIVRFLLAGAAGWFVQKGIWTSDAANEYLTAAAVAILALGWSLWARYKDRLLLLVALGLPAGSTEAEAKAVAKTTLPTAGVLLLVLTVASMPVAIAGCGQKTIHTAAIASDQFSKALVIAQNGVIDARVSGVISQTTSDQIEAVLEKVGTAGLALNEALRASDRQGALAQVQAAIDAITTCVKEDIPKLPEHDKATVVIVLSTLKGALEGYKSSLGGAL